MSARLAGLGLVVVAVVSCGGSDDQGIFGGGAGAGSGGVSGSGGEGGSGETANGGKSATGGSGASGGKTDSGVVDGGVVDGGKDGSIDSGDSAQGGTAGATSAGTGTCGNDTCAFTAGDACCLHDNGQTYCSNQVLENYCKCNGIACSTLEIFCDGPEDCPTAQLCCAEKWLASGGWDQVQCADTCKSDSFNTRREVCHIGGQACGNGGKCQSDSALPKGYGTCVQ